MRVCRPYDFNGIKGFKLGKSLFGSPMMTVYFYVIGNVMIDTGFSHMQKETLQVVRNYNIKSIFLTHHHEDHSGNAAIIKKTIDADVYGNSLTIQKMSAPFNILPYQKYMWGRTTPLTIKPLPENIETNMGTMNHIHTPGHSKDHTIYFIKDAGALFSGDLYLGDQIKFFRVDEDLGSQISSLKKILKLDFQTLLCAHHPKLEHGKKHIESKLGFLEDLYGSIVELRELGYSQNQIFKILKLKEDLFIKCFCFGNVSMINGVKSVIRCHEKQTNRAGGSLK